MSTKKIQIISSLTDTTLTESGKAADAKATGDAISLVQQNIDTVSNLVGEGGTVSEQIAEAIKDKSSVGHTHDERYYTEAEIDSMLDGKADASAVPEALADLADDSEHRTVTDDEKTIWNAKSDFSGDYNDLKNKPVIPSIAGLATEAYVDDVVETKADVEHTHGDIYYTEAEIDSKLSGKADLEHTHSNYVSITRKINSKELSSDIALSAIDVGALPDTTESPGALADLTDDATHRIVTDDEKAAWNAKSDFSGSYNDLTDKPSIPTKVSELINDSEFVTINDAAGETLGLVKSGGDVTIVDGVITVNDNSHAHTIENINGLLEAFDATVPTSRTVNGKALSSDIVLSASDVGADTIGAADKALEDAKSYTDEEIALLMNNSSTAVDSIMELAAAMQENEDVVAALNEAIGKKVDKVEGKGLSSNDYTNEEKEKLANIEDGATKTIVDDSISNTSTNPVQNKVLEAKFNEIVESYNAALATKADAIHSHAIEDVNNLQSTLDEINDALDGKADASHLHEIEDVNNLKSKLDEISNTLAQKSQVQIITWGADD